MKLVLPFLACVVLYALCIALGAPPFLTTGAAVLAIVVFVATIVFFIVARLRKGDAREKRSAR